MFEELDFQPTRIGDISLRRRSEPRLNDEVVYEVKLGDEFLMTSLVTAGEIALADLALAAIDSTGLEVVVGGLGLGYTADAVLRDKRVEQLLVVEALAPVIGWHEQELVPLGAALNRDPRCRFLNADFFELALDERGFDQACNHQFDAILLDIDHSPRHRLTKHGADFYHPDNLTLLATHLRSGGVFAMWSNEPADEPFVADLNRVFRTASAQVCEFPNPYSGATSSHTIYLAKS